jgi:hypothetical protein
LDDPEEFIIVNPVLIKVTNLMDWLFSWPSILSTV